MTWDTADTAATIGGSALGKVSSTVSYEDAGQTLVINVTADFAASDQITVADLGFDNFSAASASDNLELVVDGGNGGNTAALDDKTIVILAPLNMTSAVNQIFNQDRGHRHQHHHRHRRRHPDHYRRQRASHPHPGRVQHDLGRRRHHHRHRRRRSGQGLDHRDLRGLRPDARPRRHLRFRSR